jgi:Outer membrane protein beta-barrel domain
MRKILSVSLQVVCFSFFVNAQSQHELMISGLTGYGFGTNTIVTNISDKTLQPYNYGYAFRLGYRFESNLYLGLAATFQNGESADITTGSGTYSVNTQIEYYGLEIGRFIPLNNQILLCPYVGIGVGQIKGNFWGEEVSFAGNDIETIQTGLRPCVFPGLMIQVMTGNNIIVGADFRYTAVVDYQHANAPSLFLFIGLEI